MMLSWCCSSKADDFDPEEKFNAFPFDKSSLEDNMDVPGMRADLLPAENLVQERTRGHATDEQSGRDQELKLVFQAKGKHHPVVFKCKPRCLTFSAKLPMVVELSLDPPVKAGWVLKSVNDKDIQECGMTHSQVHDLLQTCTEKLVSKGHSIPVVFESQSAEHRVVFRQRPLGLTLSEPTLTVTSTSDIASSLGVERGWVVRKVFDQDVSDSGMTNNKVVSLMKVWEASLPKCADELCSVSVAKGTKQAHNDVDSFIESMNNKETQLVGG